MATRKLAQDEWATYFNAVSKYLRNTTTYAEIRVIDPAIGAQSENIWSPLSGITYDRKDNMLEVDVDGIDHMIFRPSEIYVEEQSEVLPRSIEVLQGKGKQVIELR
jgi:hypothetical protein